ncbi:hypothetical protein BGZ67_008659 [Mortierella alpina]|nr:hypothetical protein BGZ67_008659 [Mortierella alpina]
MKLIGYDTQPSPIHADKQYYGNRGDQSHPTSWPFLRRGINYYSSKETNNYVYLIGNPLVWWATTITAVMYISRSRCERVRSLGGWEFVCQRQNLAYARPQAAAAKIVIEDRAEHEKHEEAEKWNSQFYDHAATAMDLQNDNAQEDQTGQENHEHDHEGPFSEEESEHYEHEHFRHPQGHGHVDQNKIPVERMNKAADPGANVNTAEEEEERRLLAEKKALDARQKELEELLLARQRAHEQRLQEQQQEQLKAQDTRARA